VIGDLHRPAFVGARRRQAILATKRKRQGRVALPTIRWVIYYERTKFMLVSPYDI
jgi:hypothetical protein